MPMTRQQFNELPIEHRHALTQKASALGLTSPLVLDPTDAQPVKPVETHEIEQQRIMNEIRAERRRKAGDFKPELPDESEARAIAQRLGLDPAHIRTRQQAEREAQRTELESLVAAGESAKIVSRFGHHSDPDIRQAAREAVAHLWPSYAETIGWKD